MVKCLFTILTNLEKKKMCVQSFFFIAVFRATLFVKYTYFITYFFA